MRRVDRSTAVDVRVLSSFLPSVVTRHLLFAPRAASFLRLSSARRSSLVARAFLIRPLPRPTDVVRAEEGEPLDADVALIVEPSSRKKTKPSARDDGDDDDERSKSKSKPTSKRDHVAWHPSRPLLACASSRGVLHLWSRPDRHLSRVPAGDNLHESSDAAAVANGGGTAGGTAGGAPITALAWSDDGARLLSGDARGVIVAWRVDDRGRLKRTTSVSVEGVVITHVVAPSSRSNTSGSAASAPTRYYFATRDVDDAGRGAVYTARDDADDGGDPAPSMLFELDAGVSELLHRRVKAEKEKVSGGVFDGERLVTVRSISHWFPYDRVDVVNADP